MDLVAVGPTDEEFLLDLLNTTPVVDGEPRDDLASRRSPAPGCASTASRRPKQSWRHSSTARSVLQKVVRGEQTPAVLQRFLETVALRPTASRDGVDWRLAVNGGPRGAVRAVLAWDALRVSSPGGSGRAPIPNAACS